jgi:hypothetical protein
VLGVLVGRSVLVVVPLLVKPVVQGAMGGSHGQPHALVSAVCGTGAHRIQAGHGAFDLIDDGTAVTLEGMTEMQETAPGCGPLEASGSVGYDVR